MSAAEERVVGVDLDVEALMRLRLLFARSGARRAAAAAPFGGLAQRRRGRGAETYDVRPWSDGDDIRNLDRNVTARTGAPHVRSFHDERERSVLFLVDFRAPMLFGTRRAFRSVAAAEAAVAAAWRVIEQRGRVGLGAIGAEGARCFGWAAGARGLPPLIVALVEAHRAALSDNGEAVGPSLAAALEQMESVGGSSAVSLASALDFPGEAFDAIAARLARRRDLSVLLIADRFELAPAPGLYPFRTGEEEGTLRIAQGAAPAPDQRPARLRRLGARALEVDAGLEAEAVARLLERFDMERFDGRSV
ncbi:DUF58 domain-containing protein [Methylosinus sp. KRF6]|uniref:DUF58 domain-containing protein n=1 Tax=Methylosinus sp. KRF6 TaxID=2846853 RepID=UPI001C0C8D3F|nr:DUF58 domain-containing protein [Methylosinus sp. KRF6]MBU3887489.1 DUF58 domain-containing protein [Methylosinus sp. KRF6]